MADEILKKENLRALKILEVIANRIVNPKYSEKIDGARWTNVKLPYFAKAARCSNRTVIKHVNLLIDRGIVVKSKLSKDSDDTSNWYSLNLACLDSPEKAALFSPPRSEENAPHIINLNTLIISIPLNMYPLSTLTELMR